MQVSFLLTSPPSFLHPPIQPILNTFFTYSSRYTLMKKISPALSKITMFTLGVVNNQLSKGVAEHSKMGQAGRFVRH